VASPDQLHPFAVRIGHFARPVLIAAAYILPIGLIVHAITFWGRGIIDSEAMEFVLNYLQNRPFFAQIFDPQINDWGAYQARELSYVFDLIDARVFAALLDHHVLVFVPLSGVLGLSALSAVYFWGARRVLALNGVALCDRQGFYYLISATFVVLILWLIAKVRGQSAERCYFRVIFVNAAAIGATIFYNRIFAPWLIYALNGYWPNFSYQQLPWSKLLDPALPAKTWHLFQQQVSFFFGNAPFLVLASIIVVAAIGIAWKWRRAINRNHLTLLAVSVVSIIAIIGLLATMIAPSGRLFYPRSFVLVLHVDGARCDSLWSQRVAQFSQSARPLASQPAHLCHDRNSDCG